MNVGIWFPGQGVGCYESARTIPHEAILNAVGLSGTERAYAADLLKKISTTKDLSLDTATLQPGLFLISYYLYSQFASLLVPHDRIYAGHSLGQYAAAVAAGWCSPVTGFRLVRARGELMQAALEKQDPRGGMTALLGDYDLFLTEYIVEQKELFIANKNSAREIIISGTASALAQLSARATEYRVRPYPLSVAGPFHSPLMDEAAVGLVHVLRHAHETRHFHDTSFPLIGNTCGRPLRASDEILTEMSAHMTSPVEWDLSMKEFHKTDLIIQVGPGDILARLGRRALPGQDIVLFADPHAGVEHLTERLMSKEVHTELDGHGND